MTGIILAVAIASGQAAMAAPGAAATLRDSAPKAAFPWDLWRYSPSGPQVYLGLEWKGFQAAPEYEVIKKFAAAQGAAGEEILNGLERVLIVVSADPAGKQNAKPNLFAVAQGEFDLGKLRRLAVSEGSAIRKWKGVEFVVAPNAAAGDPVVALVDSSTLMVGSRDRVVEALARAQRSGPSTPELAALSARAAELASVAQVWAVSSIKPFEAMGGPSAMFNGIESLDAGLNFHNAFELNIALGAASEAEAVKLRTAMQAAMQLAASQAPLQNPLIDRALEAVEWKATGKKVEMRFSMSREKITSMVASLAGKPNGDPAGSPAAAPALRAGALRAIQPPPPPVPARPRVIRIEGLDQGALEIPYDRVP